METLEQSSDMIDPMENRSDLYAEKLRFSLESRGWSVKQLADATGLPVNSLYNITRKGTVPRLYAAKLIAQSLSLPMEYFADDEIPVEPAPAGPLALASDMDVHMEAALRYVDHVRRSIAITKKQLQFDWPRIAVLLWSGGLESELTEQMKLVGKSVKESVDRAVFAEMSGSYPDEKIKRITKQEVSVAEMKRLDAQLVKIPGYDLCAEYFVYRALIKSGQTDQADAMRSMAPVKLSQASALAPHVEIED